MASATRLARLNTERIQWTPAGAPAAFAPLDVTPLAGIVRVRAIRGEHPGTVAW